MLQYMIAGLVLGGVYAIAASGLVVTYLSAGILNFSFGAIAYAVARFYYFLNTQHGWPILPAAVLSILGSGPALGVFLYFALFRFLRQSSMLVKVVATLGVSVAIPPVCVLVFGNQAILAAPGLAPQPVRVFHLAGVPVTMNQIIVYGCVVAVVVVGAVVLRYTDLGLKIRAMVDSPAMTALSGINPGRVAVGVWAMSSGLAGLAGVLAAPILGLDPTFFTLLMCSAFAAVIAGRLRSLPVAVLVGLGMGIAGSLVQYWLPPSSQFGDAVLPSIPFLVMAIFLVYFMMRGASVDESAGVGGALDRAIKPQGQVQIVSRAGGEQIDRPLTWRAPLAGFVIVCAVPAILNGFWVGLLGQGVCYGIIFLSFTLVTGEGGMIWLCQASFAGAGAFTTALLATQHGWPVLPSILLGGLVAVPLGVLIGFLTTGLGDLYIALVTLTFGLLMDNLVFSQQVFQNGGTGIYVLPPKLFENPRDFAWLALAVFAVISLVIVNVRRSTAGLALNAVRWTERGSKTIGISTVQMKLLVAGLAAFVAGVGGALLALSLGAAQAGNYSTLTGVIWLAALATLGIRSNVAALFGGLATTILAGIALEYLPTDFGNVPPILFGLGAIAIAMYPDGTLAEQARQMRALWAKMNRHTKASGAPPGAGPSGLAATALKQQANGSVAAAAEAEARPSGLAPL